MTDGWLLRADQAGVAVHTPNQFEEPFMKPVDGNSA